MNERLKVFVDAVEQMFSNHRVKPRQGLYIKRTEDGYEGCAAGAAYLSLGGGQPDENTPCFWSMVERAFALTSEELAGVISGFDGVPPYWVVPPYMEGYKIGYELWQKYGSPTAVNTTQP